ncbi:MAG TPA: DinB family protein [Chitinophagaceae bacterium]
MKEQVLATINDRLLATLDNSRNYTIAVAEAMPSESYSFKPVKDVWNFGEQIHHIAYGIQWWESNYVKGVKTEWAPPAVSGGKTTLISNLKKAYAELEKTLNKGKLDDDAVSGFHATIDHITHHRAQCVLYLRGNGITPPEYSY